MSMKQVHLWRECTQQFPERFNRSIDFIPLTIFHLRPSLSEFGKTRQQFEGLTTHVSDLAIVCVGADTVLAWRLFRITFGTGALIAPSGINAWRFWRDTWSFDQLEQR